MTELQKLPLTMEQAEAAIDGLTGRIVAMSAIQQALIAHIIQIAPTGIDLLRTRVALQTADAQELIHNESEGCRQLFLHEVASANQLIDKLQAVQDQQ
nr:hypothetical protein [uncultured Roseateles sp.]